MNRYGIQFQVKNSPSLDPEFMPILKFNRAFLQSAKKPVSFAVERSNGQVAVCNTLSTAPPRCVRLTTTMPTGWSSSSLWLQAVYLLQRRGGGGE